MNKERLLEIVRVLESVPEDQFGMKDWECGTVACAVGWACKDKWFQEQGLCLKETSLHKTPSYSECGWNALGWSAVEAFFGLEYYDASFLFDRYCYDGHQPSKSRVAERILSFVDGRRV